MGNLVLVAVGGALGACARYGVGLAAAKAFGAGFPWGTLAVNLAGGFAMGLLFALAGHEKARMLLFGTGFLGGFTTFSAFSLEVALMIERGVLAPAAAYVAGSTGAAIGAVFAGLAVGRGWAQ